MQVTLDGNIYTENTGSIVITNNDVNPDRYYVSSPMAGPAIGGISDPDFVMIFNDNTHAIFTRDALPTVQPDPSDFPLGNQMRLDFYDFSVFPESFGTITSNNVQVVPIPAAAWLFGSGLFGVFGIRRITLRSTTNPS